MRKNLIQDLWGLYLTWSVAALVMILVDRMLKLRSRRTSADNDNERMQS